MAYPGQFHRLVMIGTLYGDTWNMTLAIVPSALGELGMPAVDTATLNGVAADVNAWFIKTEATGGVGFSSDAKLTSIKLNRIDPNGHYVDQTAHEYVWSTPVAGPTGVSLPPQLATVATLGTRLERGRGSKGRVYLIPHSAMATGSDGRTTPSKALGVATGVKFLIDSLNARYTLIGRVGVASNAGTGLFEHVTKVGVGRVIDTMRSRRSTLIEDRQFVTIP